jgi:RIO kinase 1
VAFYFDKELNMSRLTELNDLDEQGEFESGLNIRNLPPRERHASSKPHPRRPSKPVAPEAVEPVQHAAADDKFDFTYQATRHERVWIVDSLGDFYDGQWLDDVVRLIKGGKEAHVYQCSANASATALLGPGQEYLAAKIYRPRKFRNLKNDHLYREGRQDVDGDGRQVTDDGMLHAMAKRTEYGRGLLHTSWIGHEVTTLQRLHAAGADVPLPLTSGNNAILMSYLGDEANAAPTLNGVRLTRKEAPRLFERVIHNIDLMLAHNRIHADLSAYNILYWDGEITLIDFPQAIDPRQNRNAYQIFERDVVRVCEYFARQGVKSEPKKLASDLWSARQLHKIPDVHPRLLDADDEQDRRYWREWSS